MIFDWTPGDVIDALGVVVNPSTYAEISAPDATTAQTLANAAIAGGIDVVATQVGADVIVFFDSSNNNGTADDVSGDLRILVRRRTRSR